MFAFALVVVELLVGRSALDGGDTMQLFIAATNAARRPTPRTYGLEVSDAVEQILARALAVDSRERYATAGAFWDALVAAAAGVVAPRAATSASAAGAAAAQPHARTQLAAPSSSAPTRPVRKSGTELAEPHASAITGPDEATSTVAKSAVIPAAPARMASARSKSGLALAAGAIVSVSLAGYLTVRAASTPDMATESTDPAAQKIPWPSGSAGSPRPATAASAGAARTQRRGLRIRGQRS